MKKVLLILLLLLVCINQSAVAKEMKAEGFYNAPNPHYKSTGVDAETFKIPSTGSNNPAVGDIPNYDSNYHRNRDIDDAISEADRKEAVPDSLESNIGALMKNSPNREIAYPRTDFAQLVGREKEIEAHPKDHYPWTSDNQNCTDNPSEPNIILGDVHQCKV